MLKRTLTERVVRMIQEQEPLGWLRHKGATLSNIRCLTFHDYMRLCLYDEQEGYYRSGDVRVGREGDFYTSPYVGHVVADVLARYMTHHSSELGGEMNVMEWGGGTGRLSLQLMDAWSKDAEGGGVISSLRIVDVHPAHRLAAEEAPLNKPGRVKMQVMSAEEALTEEWSPSPVLILANELLDAMPVHRVVMDNGQLWELGVACTNGQLHEVCMPLSSPAIASSLSADYIRLREGQQTEVNLEAGRWLQQITRKLHGPARLIILDYGHEAEEYTAEHRMLGTLMCYSKHTAHTNPYVRLGEQDLTAHVPYTALRREAEAMGWTTAYYGTQQQFLTQHGLLELLQPTDGVDPFSPSARRNRAIRQVLLSDGMSEAFKVMVLDYR
ncbi:class I SAM-dependent methyltransferase [Paenibacillus sp. GCM10023252]|uniref:class I SAM-dependent methyltransferase n=1 Tax=Paenibacillus sp. GCM10023252 TaxID=3252649 RepID=UPI00360A29F7